MADALRGWAAHAACLLVGILVGLTLQPGSESAGWAVKLESASSFPLPARGDAGRLPMCTEPVSILSLDGGGIRGLIGSTVLEELEVILTEKTGRSVGVGDFFDVVVGTSTGGLQALALLLGYNASSLSEIYMVDGKQIFGNDTVNCKQEHLQKMEEHCSLNFYDLGGLIYDCLPAVAHCYLAYPTYDSSGISATARKHLGNRTTAEDFGGRVFGLTTYDLVRGAPVTFTNLGATPGSTYYLADAALATSAAPTFFNPHRMTCVGCSDPGHEILAVDGALYANNPTLIAYELAERMAAERRGCQLTPDRAMVLSLGTGRDSSHLYSSGNIDLTDNTLGTVIKTVVQFLEYNDTRWWDEQWGTLKWIFLPLTIPRLELLSAALTGQEELTDQFFRKVFGSAGSADRYLRINVDLTRTDHTTPFGADEGNLATLRGIGSEAVDVSRRGLARFADELIAAQPDLVRDEFRPTFLAPSRRPSPGIMPWILGAALCIGLAGMATREASRNIADGERVVSTLSESLDPPGVGSRPRGHKRHGLSSGAQSTPASTLL